MNILRNLSIYYKILFTILVITLIVASCSIAIFLRNDIPQYRNLVTLFEDLNTQSNALNSAFIENNPSQVSEILKILKVNPNISLAEVYAFDGKRFVPYSLPTDSTSASIPVDNPIEGSPFNFLDKKLELFLPIIKEDKMVGALHIKTTNIHSYLHLFVEMMILIVILAFFLAVYLTEMITKPLQTLTEAMKKVAVQNDYTVRLPSKNSNNEMGILINTFNNMLETIQSHEKLQRSSAEEIKRLAFYDALTGLPNRELFKELANSLLREANQNKQMLGILYLDINHFKTINDHIGWNNGDKLLQKIVHSLALHLPNLTYQKGNDFSGNKPIIVSNFARMSADKFLLSVQNISSPQECVDIAQLILSLLNKDYLVDTHEVNIQFSIGAALFPQHGENIETLITHAETAMHVAKEKGAGQCGLFDNQLGKVIAKKTTLEQALYKAIEHDELFPFYQPKLNLQTEQLHGAELLLRWQHPQLGMISPNEFIPIAESTDLIIDIGGWALEVGCKECKRWHDRGFTQLQISINLSPRQFADPQLITKVTTALKNAQLDPTFLELELTESTIMMSDEKTLNTLASLKETGIQISVDDFGTGYSSLRYLAKYPIDTIKIDKSFIMYLLENKSNATITKTIIDLAHNLNLKVIAEGVETRAQYDFLQKNKCNGIQGYYLSKPLSSQDIMDFFVKSTRDLYATGT